MSFVAGASASIMKTLGEIESILKGERLCPAGEKRMILRDKLQAVIIKSSRVWYRKGFNRGHKESFRQFKQGDHIPSALAVDVEREFVPKTKSTVKLKSTLSKAFRKSVSP